MNRKTIIELTNMCLLFDDKNRVLVQKKKGLGGGFVYPGGHVEVDESLTDSVIREIEEETGLTIRSPQLCGFKDWIQDDGSRYIVIIYKATEFSGELKDSEEGEMLWVDKNSLENINLVWDSKAILHNIVEGESNELFFKIMNGEYINKRFR